MTVQHNSADRKETISVFGLGYVGTVTAACLASQGHRIIGVDVHPTKVSDLASGHSPIVEPEVEALLQDSHGHGLLTATDKTQKAISDSAISIICVGTPSLPNGGLNLEYVENVTRQIAAAIHAKEAPHTLIFRSTMLPGSTRGLVNRFLTDLVADYNLKVLFVPEFLREGSAVEDFRNPSLSVIGTADGTLNEQQLIELLGGGTDCAIVRWEEAEAVKYACNAFHAVKVGFANEIGRLAKAHGIDGRAVMNILCDDSRLNISKYYMRPGNPYGGSCLPKDVAALNSFAALSGTNAPILRSLNDSNRDHQDLLLDRVLSAGSKKIGLFGLSFKSATDDLRNSPMVYLAESLLGKGMELAIYDPQLQLDKLIGSNESMIAKSLPHLKALLRETPEDVMGESDVLVVAQKCVTIDVLKRGVTDQHHIIDVNSWPELESLRASYDGLCWDSHKSEIQ